jgi:oligoribonuclease
MFVFLDLETGDLPTNRPCAEIPILEVGVIITDANLVELDAHAWVVHHSQEVLDAMDPWCVRVHGESGLTQESLEATKTLAEVEQEMLAYYRPIMLPEEITREGKNGRYGTLPMCGSSVHFDREFVQTQMPDFNALFHYRNIDVSSFRGAFEVWGHEMLPREVSADHRVLGDLRSTINELAFYRESHITDP